MAVKLQALVGSRIRQARDEMELTQPKFAERVGVAMRTVQTWEYGERIPRVAAFERIAKVTGYPVSWFYETDGSDGVLS